MTNKLAFKHKNSMALNEKKIISQESGSKSSHLYPKSFRVSNFLIITCCTFLGYWFIVCPLIWALFCHSYSITRTWPKFWPIIFWIVALIIWIFIMIFLISIWKCIKGKHNVNVKKRSYGSDGTNNPSPPLEDIQPMITRDRSNDKTSIDFDLSSKDYDKKSINNSKATDNAIQKDSKRTHGLPPLVIHRKMSKNDIENVNVVTTEKSREKDDDDDEELRTEDIQETNVNRNSIKDYLKLVTPLEEDKNIISPKTPMSPRDLFFIDMIKAAEKAEKNKENEKEDLNKRHCWFLPENTIASKIDSIDSKKNNSDNKNSKKDDSDKDNKDDEKQVERELNYFIADIESPKNEKTEVFIEINKTLEPDTKKKSKDLCTVKINENNSILTFENKFGEKDGLKENRDM